MAIFFTVLSDEDIPIFEFISIDEGEQNRIAEIDFTAYLMDHAVNAVESHIMRRNRTKRGKNLCNYMR
jgi:hypothetical protein